MNSWLVSSTDALIIHVVTEITVSKQRLNMASQIFISIKV